ncbi:MAG: type II toxin-antitoxin system HicA family toxin [Ignavibacteria bacterium]
MLTANGFEYDNTVGSHAQYIGIIKGQKRRVTVDMHIDDFDDNLIKSMISQSGLSREDFYCSTKTTAKKINKINRKDLK